ncbi:MAG TPA: DegV family protein, partial [Dehalococcoidia bacterium]|nr:DegV family protein [Dehalococcoidia bacterium]
MTIRIVTDSTADLDTETLREHGIVVVPLNVHMGDQTFLDTVTITKNDFYSQMQASQLLPRTSQPSAGAFQEAYEQVIAEGDVEAIASIHLSGKLSGTVNAAQTGAGLLTDSPPITVIDSNSATLGLGNAVLAAAEAAEAGADMDGVRAACISAAARTRVLLFVDTLEYLQKGGRIGRARAFLGTLLRTKPLLELRDGEIEGIERPRTRQKAIDRLFQTIVRTPHPERIEILYGTTPTDAQSLADRVEAALPGVPVGIVQVSSVIGVHT